MSIYDAKNTRAMDLATKWHKFSEVGSKCGGEIIGVAYQAANGVNKAQVVLTVKEEGTNDIVNIGVKDTDYMRPRISSMRIGDGAGFIFEKLVPSRKPKHADAKSIAVRHAQKDGNMNKTVAEILGWSSIVPASAEKDINTDEIPFG